MSDALIASESKQILGAIQALRGDVQARDEKLDHHLAKAEEQLKLMGAEIHAIQTASRQNSSCELKK